MVRHHQHAFAARQKLMSSMPCEASLIDVFHNTLCSVTKTLLVSSVVMSCENLGMTKVVLECINVSMHAASSKERHMAPQRIHLRNVLMSGYVFSITNTQGHYLMNVYDL